MSTSLKTPWGLIPGYTAGKKTFKLLYRSLGPCTADGLGKLIHVTSVLSDRVYGITRQTSTEPIKI
jgi:hypothetical protein